jgi:hypothetical protein
LDALAHVQSKSGILCHPRCVLGKHHHVGIRNSEGRIFDRLAVEAHRPE